MLELLLDSSSLFCLQESLAFRPLSFAYLSRHSLYAKASPMPNYHVIRRNVILRIDILADYKSLDLLAKTATCKYDLETDVSLTLPPQMPYEDCHPEHRVGQNSSQFENP